MSSLTISNLPDYSKITVAFILDDSYTSASLNLKIYTSKTEYTEDSPSHNYTIEGLTSENSGDEYIPTDFNEEFDKYVDGIYLFTITSNAPESVSEQYLITYNASIIVAVDTINVCRQLEEDDDRHLEDALWAIWGEELLVGMDRGGAVGLEPNALGFLDYTKKYLNQ